MDSNTKIEDKRMQWKFIAVKVALFLLVFLALLLIVSRVMTVNSLDYEQLMISGVYKETPNTLDAVYIGSSNCFAFWNPVAAFAEYGIAVMPFVSDSQPLTVAENLIRDARKTQPDAVYIVNINSLEIDDDRVLAMHYLLDCMPFSLEKMELTAYLIKSEGLSWQEGLEYYIPLIRYHSRWDQLGVGHFVNASKQYKNSYIYEHYFSRIEDVGGNYNITDTVETVETVGEELEERLHSLLDYCDEENVKVLFVTVPQAKNEQIIGRYNGVNDLIASRGYPVLNLLADIEKTGIQTVSDFYNMEHTNIHGSLKFTHYLSRYLLDRYGFADKRENPAYESWHKALEGYFPEMERYVLDFEIHGGSRDYCLEPVRALSAVCEDGCVRLSWDADAAADRFAVYRKTQWGWNQVCQETGSAFVDRDVEEGETYTYTIVPCREQGDEVLYGNFSYDGVTITVQGKD